MDKIERAKFLMGQLTEALKNQNPTHKIHKAMLAEATDHDRFLKAWNDYVESYRQHGGKASVGKWNKLHSALGGNLRKGKKTDPAYVPVDIPLVKLTDVGTPEKVEDKPLGPVSKVEMTVRTEKPFVMEDGAEPTAAIDTGMSDKQLLAAYVVSVQNRYPHAMDVLSAELLRRMSKSSVAPEKPKAFVFNRSRVDAQGLAEAFRKKQRNPEGPHYIVPVSDERSVHLWCSPNSHWYMKMYLEKTEGYYTDGGYTWSSLIEGPWERVIDFVSQHHRKFMK